MNLYSLYGKEFNSSDVHKCQRFFSENISYAYKVPGTPITAKILIIAISQLIFLVFLFCTLPNSIKIFKRAVGRRAIRLAYFVLIWVTLFIRILRFIALWIFPKSNIDADVAETIIQIILRTFMFTVEISIIIFMYNGIKRTKNIIKRVTIESMIITVFFVVLLILSNWLKGIPTTDGYLGPTIFWLFQNALFVVVYSAILIIRFFSPLANYLPRRATYYSFAYVLLFSHLLEFIGHMLVIFKHVSGYCFLSIGQLCYLIFILPLVYMSFLWKFLHQRVKTGYEPMNTASDKFDSDQENDFDAFDTINTDNFDQPDILISNSSTQTDMKDFSSRISSILSDETLSSNLEYNGL